MHTLRDIIEKINISGPVLENEPLSNHTSFQVGGPADIYVKPADKEDLIAVVSAARSESHPVFILGGGANILVSDKGIRGLVVDLSGLSALSRNGYFITAGAGIPVSHVAEYAAENSLTGMEFIYSMPGSVGGSVYMNARCYYRSVSDALVSVTYLDDSLRTVTLKNDYSSYGYKISPFQNTPFIITEAMFYLTPGEKHSIYEAMNNFREDRTKKGHFIYPCAGSIFKNNRNFGKPTGVILDSLGLRGFSVGGAKIAEFHANIIVNSGNAKASDIKELIEIAEKKAKEAYGFSLEREILLVGEWS